MMDEVVSITRIFLHDGRLAAFQRLFEQCRQITSREDTGTLQYEAYLSEDAREAVIIERYQDAAAVLEHTTHVGADLLVAVMATGTVHREAYGVATPELAAIAQRGDVRLLSPWRPT